MYVIKKDGVGYVADMQITKTGRSYTAYLQAARVFLNEEAAEHDKCGNEIVVSVQREMNVR